MNLVEQIEDGKMIRSDWLSESLANLSTNIIFPRKAVVGFVFIMALAAFEIFNFDTTRFALSSLLGDVQFWGMTWAAILAIAFCAIDFAGLARLFTPERGQDEPKFVWYLMGAWLLGATMNAIMTWWAVNLNLLNHDLGNEILSREQLLQVVPLFVAVLVWLTRILFIGAFAVAGEHLFARSEQPAGSKRQPVVGRHMAPVLRSARPAMSSAPGLRLVPNEGPNNVQPMEKREPTPVSAFRPSRIHRRPPTPGRTRSVPLGMQARGSQR